MNGGLRWVVDIETLGTGANAVVLSVGVIDYDNGNKIHTRIDPVQQQKDGREIDVSTIKWWTQQSDEARASLFGPTNNVTDIYMADATEAAGMLATAFEGAHEIWGFGSDFDNVILANFMKQYAPEFRWPFWANRCLRTLKGLFCERYVLPEIQGIAHNALDDAKYQCEVLRAIREGLKEDGINT